MRKTLSTIALALGLVLAVPFGSASAFDPEVPPASVLPPTSPYLAAQADPAHATECADLITQHVAQYDQFYRYIDWEDSRFYWEFARYSDEVVQYRIAHAHAVNRLTKIHRQERIIRHLRRELAAANAF